MPSYVGVIFGNWIELGDNEVRVNLKANSLNDALEEAKELNVCPSPDFIVYRALEDEEGNLLAISTNWWKVEAFASFDEALVTVIPAMKLQAGESVSFKVAGFPQSIGVTEYRLTLSDKGGDDFTLKLENLFKGEWVDSSRSLDVFLAISFVRKARREGFWLPS